MAVEASILRRLALPVLAAAPPIGGGIFFLISWGAYLVGNEPYALRLSDAPPAAWIIVPGAFVLMVPFYLVGGYFAGGLQAIVAWAIVALIAKISGRVGYLEVAVAATIPNTIFLFISTE
ncbi:MAG: hypothetical protein AAGJ87_02980, partial [Pseudomonadota bacterium]